MKIPQKEIIKSNKLPDSICSLPHCTICQKYRKEHGFDVKGRKKLELTNE